jgi:geranylgeranyl diphosphate synthase, type II
MIKKYFGILENEIRRQKFGKKPASLYEPIRYLMALGGKRLRPMLTLLAYRLFQDDPKKIIKYAVAVEAFHNFTLMHDDIMDKAPLRRGKATVHEKWNMSTAILSGDVMLVKVYDMFLGINEGKVKRIYSAFNKCASQVCEGQQWDMEFETRNSVTEAQYLDMIKLKTAVLLGFSLDLGATLAEASETDCKLLREFGINIGMGFQLKDDLLDAYAESETFGKLVGGDIIANKKTFLLIKALELANLRQRRELLYWMSLKKFNKTHKVEAVKEIYDDLSIPQLTERKINGFFKKAFMNLDTVNSSDETKSLIRDYTSQLIGRVS